MSILSQLSQASENEKKRDFFECGHSVAQFGWFDSQAKKIRCSVCDAKNRDEKKNAIFSGSDESNRPANSITPTLAASGEGCGEGGAQQIDRNGPQPSPYAFCEVTTPNGAYLVATRFPSDWTASSGNRRINRRAGIMFGWPDDLGDDRPRSLDEWREQIRKTAEGINVRG